MPLRFAIQDLLWLLLLAGILCAWWIQNSRLRTKLLWAETRADTNGESVMEVCKAFEREENYTCDVFTVKTPHGDFYTAVNVIRPTDSSFYVELPGEKYLHLSVDLQRKPEGE
jgi:hypothetical protein